MIQKLKTKNKRGGVFQLTYLFVFLFCVALIGLIFFKLSWEFTEEYKKSPEINDTIYARQANQRMQNIMPYIFDQLVFLFFLGSVIALMVAAVRTDFSPVVVGLFIILMILTIIIATGLVNIYQGFATSDELVGVASKLTFTNIIFSQYTPLILMVLAALILIAMYGKSGGAIIK